MEQFSKRLICLPFLLLIYNNYYCQAKQDTLKKEEVKTVISGEKPKVDDDKKITFSSLIVADYGISLTDKTDIYGKNQTTANYSSNGFYLRYARLQAKMDISKDISGQFLVNFADFKDNPLTKVLEIAAVKYHYNNYFNFQFGQFRPYFGLEDMYASELSKTYYWSNQYSLFSRNNWQSFQLGAAIFGSLDDQKIPLKYYYTYSNGNGKNQNGDNDNPKTHSFRAEYKFRKRFVLAGNAAFTRDLSQNASAFGADLTYEKQINNHWHFGLDTEYKYGANLKEYEASTKINKSISDYYMQGIYVLPFVRKSIKTKLFSALEFSCRYEYLENLTKNGNPSRIYTPMVSIVSGIPYTTKISLVAVLQNYNNQVANTTQWNSNQLLLQVQIKY